MSRLFLPPQHPAASQSYRHLVQRVHLLLCSEIKRVQPRVTPAALCLLQVSIKTLAFSSTLADRGNPRTVCDCFHVVSSVFHVPEKNQLHIN